MCVTNFTDENEGFEMKGGKITGNIAETGGGVYLAYGNNFTVSGNSKIEGNTLTDETTNNNVYIFTDYTINVGQMTDGASVGITRKDGKGVFTAADASDYVGKFFSDLAQYKVVVTEDATTLSLADNDVTYKITVGTIENGSVTVNNSLTEAWTGAIITLIVTPAISYVLRSVEGTYGPDNTNNVTIEKWATEEDYTHSFTMPEGNVTISAIFVKGTPIDTDGDGILDIIIVINNSGNSGGGSSMKYSITVKDAKNGNVDVSSKAKKGVGVTLTVTPEDGYELESLKVVDRNGNEIEVKEKGDGVYTFVMPRSNVTVSGSFTDGSS